MRTDRDYAESLELVEEVMEWIGMRWTISMIKRELRSYFGEDLSFQTCNWLVKAAKKLIRERFNIDPQEYKGIQITFYEGIIRNVKEKTQNQLKAAERLDSLFGLEQVTGDDPEVQALKIREALKEMDKSIGEQDDGENDKRNKNEGNSKVNSKDNETSSCRKEFEQNSSIEQNKTIEENIPAEDDIDAKKAIEELSKLKEEDLDRLRKKKG